MKGFQEQMGSALAFKPDHFIKTVEHELILLQTLLIDNINFHVSEYFYFLPVLVLKANGISFLLKLIFFDAHRHDFGGMHQSWRF